MKYVDPVLISADDLVELSSKNNSLLDYELFKKTDQVDSFLRQVSLVSGGLQTDNECFLAGTELCV